MASAAAAPAHVFLVSTSPSGSPSPADWSPTPPPHNSSTRCGFHVPYEVRDGAYGKGLYALARIPAGTLMWKYSGGAPGAAGVNVYQFRTEAEARARLAGMSSDAERRWFVEHVYTFDGVMNEIVDDGALWNHSEAPNTGLPPPGDEFCFQSTYSVRDIEVGEEFLDDYGTYEHADWYRAMLKEHGAPDTAEYVTYKPLITRESHAAAGAATAAAPK